MKFVDENVWKVKHYAKISSVGITSEVLVVEKSLSYISNELDFR
jgi:hypothetical protein